MADDDFLSVFQPSSDQMERVRVKITLEGGLTVEGVMDKATAGTLVRDPDDPSKLCGDLKADGCQDVVIVLPRAELVAYECFTAEAWPRGARVDPEGE